MFGAGAARITIMCVSDQYTGMKSYAFAIAVLVFVTVIVSIILGVTLTQPGKQLAQNSDVTVYVVGGVKSGGSKRFIDDLKQFTKHNYAQLLTKRQLQEADIRPHDVLFVQHVFPDIMHDFEVQDVLDAHVKSTCRMIINIHDFYWMDIADFSPHKMYLRDTLPAMHPSVLSMFASADLVIHPSKFTYEHFERAFPSSNFAISDHIDIPKVIPATSIPAIPNKTIRIGVLHEISEYKGAEMLRALQRDFATYREFTIQFCIAGETMPKYKEDSFLQTLQARRIHGVTLLNKWGETYSYLLSKCLNSGLPILYNNFGSFKERIPKHKRFFAVYNSEHEFDNAMSISFLNSHHIVETFLDFIIDNANKSDSKPLKDSFLVTRVPPLYKFVLTDAFVPQIWDQIHKHVQMYAVYVTPSQNALRTLKDRSKTVAYPDLSKLHVLTYNCSSRLISNQIQMAHEWGLNGFGLDITPSASLPCIAHFFKKKLENGFKVFFMSGKDVPDSVKGYIAPSDGNYIRMDANSCIQVKFGSDTNPKTAAQMRKELDEALMTAAKMKKPLLLHSWNDWLHQQALEPSTSAVNLQLLKQACLRFLTHL